MKVNEWLLALGVGLGGAVELKAQEGLQGDWGVFLSLDKLSIVHDNSEATSAPSVFWSFSLGPRYVVKSPVIGGWNLDLPLTLGLSKYYVRNIYFFFGGVGIGPRVSLGQGIESALHLGYVYQQELHHGSKLEWVLEKEIAGGWWVNIGLAYTRFLVPKDAGLRVDERSLSIGIERAHTRS